MIKITNGRPNLYAVLKNPPTKIQLNNPKIKQAIPNAKRFAFISALFRYTMDREKTVIRRTTAAAISKKAQPSIRQTNRYFPFTTSRFAIGRSVENTISFAGDYFKGIKKEEGSLPGFLLPDCSVNVRNGNRSWSAWP